MHILFRQGSPPHVPAIWYILTITTTSYYPPPSCRKLNSEPQRKDTLAILDNLVTAQLALTIQTVDKSNGHLSNRAAHGLGTNHHLHLERVPLAHGARNDLLQHTLLVQSEATSDIADTRAEDSGGKQVGAAADKLALQVPAKHTTVASIARARNNIVVGRLLHCDHLRDELWVVAKVGVHDDDKVARRKLQAVHVGGSEAELAGARLEEDVRFVGLDELVGHFLGSVGRSVVDNDELPVEVTGRKGVSGLLRCHCALVW